MDPLVLELYFKKFTSDFNRWLPDGVIEIDLNFLHKENLLHFYSEKNYDSLTRYFQVIESSEKITLVNEDFVIWIIPSHYREVSATYILIAKNKSNLPNLELVFVISGVYNFSKLILKLIEKFLYEIQTTEKMLLNMEENNKSS